MTPLHKSGRVFSADLLKADLAVAEILKANKENDSVDLQLLAEDRSTDKCKEALIEQNSTNRKLAPTPNMPVPPVDSKGGALNIPAAKHHKDVYKIVPALGILGNSDQNEDKDLGFDSEEDEWTSDDEDFGNDDEEDEMVHSKGSDGKMTRRGLFLYGVNVVDLLWRGLDLEQTEDRGKREVPQDVIARGEKMLSTLISDQFLIRLDTLYEETINSVSALFEYEKLKGRKKQAQAAHGDGGGMRSVNEAADKDDDKDDAEVGQELQEGIQREEGHFHVDAW